MYDLIPEADARGCQTSVNMADPKTKDSKKLDEFITKVDEIETLVGNM